MKRLLPLVVLPCLLLARDVCAAPSKRHMLSLQLVQAVKRRDSKRVRHLLRLGANPNARDDSGRAKWNKQGNNKTQVWSEKKQKQITVSQSSLMQPFQGPTVLMIAAYQRDFSTAQALLNANAKRDLTGVEVSSALSRTQGLDLETRFTPLCEAMMAGSPQMMRLLLRHGANVNARNSDGTTPRFLLESMKPTGGEAEISVEEQRFFKSLLAVLRAYGAHRFSHNYP